MKKTINILILSCILFVGCRPEPEKSFERPAHLPKDIPVNWGHYEQRAYEEGRLHYISDSTACYIDGERLMTPGHVEEAKQNPNSIIINHD
jgi:hypothetical protein